MFSARHVRVLAAAASVGALVAAAVPAVAADRASETPAQILHEMQDDVAALQSYHVTLTGRDDDGRTTLSGDFTARGDVRMHMSINQGKFSLIVANDITYMRANESFWRSNDAASVAKKLADRWIKLTPALAQSLADAYTLFEPKNVARCAFHDLGTIVKAGTGSVGHRHAVILRDKGDKPGASPGRLWIATNGRALPLRSVQTGPERPGGAVDKSCGDDGSKDTTKSAETRFSRFDAVSAIHAPKGALSLEKLTAAGGSA